MNAKLFVLAIFIVGSFLVGCQASSSDYSAYGNPSGQGQQNQYVGGGCGVAPADSKMPAGAFDSTAASA